MHISQLISLILFVSINYLNACKTQNILDKRPDSSASSAATEANDEITPDRDSRFQSPMNIGNMPYAKDINNAISTFLSRKQFVVEYFANQPIGDFPSERADSLDFAARAVASIRKNRFTEDLDKVLSRGRAFGSLGSSINSESCIKKGDFDFTALGLTWVLYEASMKSDALSRSTLEHLMTNLLPSGSDHYERIADSGCQNAKDSQSRIFISETSRYLNNQMIKRSLPAYKNDEKFDNKKSNFNIYMRETLRSLYISFFDDYNARPTEAANLMALHLLYNYAEDASVRTLSEGLLHLTSALYAVQTSNGRRMAVFHREQKNNKLSDLYQGDGQIAHMAVLAGNHKYYADINFEVKDAKYLAMMASASNYSLPISILSLINEPSYNEYLQIFKHRNYEVYYNSQSYKISGGGWYNKNQDLVFDEIETIAQPLVIFPTKSSELDYKKFIHFQGKSIKNKAENHCLTKNFACGIDLVVPTSIPDSCRSAVAEMDKWKFFNFSSAACPLKWGFYAAVYKGAYNREDSSLKNFGIVELHEAGDEFAFDRFKNGVKNNHRNSNIKYNERYVYKPVFQDDDPKFKNGIHVLVNTSSVTDSHFEGRWPFIKDLLQEKRALGPIIKSDSGMKYEIDSPAFSSSVSIDISNQNNPIIREIRN